MSAPRTGFKVLTHDFRPPVQGGAPVVTVRAAELLEQAEEVARLFHEAYERLAPSFGYETRKESAVPWNDVPEQNRRLMVAVVEEVGIPALAARLRDALTVIEAARENERLLHSLLRGAWDELEAAEAHHRWHHEQEGREVEPREERLALLMELSEALDDEATPEPFASVSDVLAATLRFLATNHHRTLTNSKLHDPERIIEFADCPCLPCRKAAAALRLAERAAFDAGPAATEEATLDADAL